MGECGTPTAGQGSPGREGVGERTKSRDRLVERLAGETVVHGAVQPVLRGDDAAVQRAALRSQAEREITPVDRVDAAFDQTLRDEPVDEPARAVAGLADEQSAEGVQRQWAVVAEHAQNLCLG